MDWSAYTPDELKTAEKILRDLSQDSNAIAKTYSDSEEWYTQYSREACGLAGKKQDVEQILDNMYRRGEIEQR